MKCEWKSCKLYEVADIVDSLHRTPQYTECGIPMLRVTDIKEGYLSLRSPAKVSPETYDEFTKKHQPKQGDIVISRVGTYGVFAYVATKDKFCLGQNTAIIIPHINKKFLYYSLISPGTKEYLNRIVTGSTQKTISLKNIKTIPLSVPDDTVQERIVDILSALDDKIELNNRINENLFEQVLSLYRRMFVETAKDQRLVCRADEYFDISIGKTPPRKESEWFSHESFDRVWVSIADMGNCGIYISDSSEHLTHEAVERFNVKLVPGNTVILSFKLTVGRVAITDGMLTTNEAIAHFKTKTPEINEYLYCYLKKFNYQTMGSTSSIATAVNSKIIKAMPFVVPTDEELAEFHNVAGVAFEEIKQLQRENVKLTALRDSLLPKLMSGEINVEDVKI